MSQVASPECYQCQSNMNPSWSCRDNKDLTGKPCTVAPLEPNLQYPTLHGSHLVEVLELEQVIYGYQEDNYIPISQFDGILGRQSTAPVDSKSFQPASPS